nr:GNAT family N-acetyltransferase [Ruficoccus amylovorans]
MRHWREDDFPALATLCADPAVMRYFPAPLSEEETRTLFARIRGHFEEHGFGLYAVEKKADARWVGFVGLLEVGADLPFAPATEIAWRLSPEHWYNGYATEAARAVLDFGFNSLGREEIVAFTTESNTPSQRVMRRLGMQTCTDEDFNHPRLPADHPLRLHRLYRLRRPEGHATT